MESLQNINEPSKGQGPAGNDQIIHYMLKAMELRVDELKESIDTSKISFPLGLDTDLTIYFKDLIKDPIAQLLKMRGEMDNSVGAIITRVVKEFFKNHSDKIEMASIIERGNIKSELHYLIVLKDDSSENRTAIFNFLADYNSTNLADAFPVYFQFAPKEIASQINSKEIVIEN